MNNTDSDRHSVFTLPNVMFITISILCADFTCFSQNCCVDSKVYLCKCSAQCLAWSKLLTYTIVSIIWTNLSFIIEKLANALGNSKEDKSTGVILVTVLNIHYFPGLCIYYFEYYKLFFRMYSICWLSFCYGLWPKHYNSECKCY